MVLKWQVHTRIMYACQSLCVHYITACPVLYTCFGSCTEQPVFCYILLCNCWFVFTRLPDVPAKTHFSLSEYKLETGHKCKNSALITQSRFELLFNCRLIVLLRPSKEQQLHNELTRIPDKIGVYYLGPALMKFVTCILCFTLFFSFYFLHNIHNLNPSCWIYYTFMLFPVVCRPQT